MKGKSKFMVAMAALTVGVIGCVGLVGCTKSDKHYREEVNNYKVGEERLFTNDIADSMPQTVIYKLIKEHFESAPTYYTDENGDKHEKKKKAIFLGYDGYRADGLLNIKDNPTDKSAIMKVREEGGLYLTYSGGKEPGNQATSTAPSWSAMLTGGWGDYNGVFDNGTVKEKNAPTILTELVDKSKKDGGEGFQASFTTSWRHHQQVTYFLDKDHADRTGIDYDTYYDPNYSANNGGKKQPLIKYTDCKDDSATYDEVIRQVSKPAGVEKSFDPDMIFFTFEHGDHAGHSFGFSNDVPEYVRGTKEADAFGSLVLDALYSRSTFEQEDWLIIISTDHGGNKKGHGGPTMFERTTWLACNKKLDADKIKGDYQEQAHHGDYTKEGQAEKRVSW